MIYRLIALFALILTTTSTADAGPWLREKGSSFLSFSLSATPDLDARGAGYLEFGMTPSTTVVLDLGYLRQHTGSELGYGTLFVRRALGPTDRTHRFAYEIGFGATYGGPTSDMRPHVKTGLTWGRGLEIRGKGGWITSDASALWDIDESEHVYKLDTTLGLNFNATLTGILQLNFAHQEEETFGYFEPSLVFSPKRVGLKIQMGLSVPTKTPDETALKIGFWQEF